MPRHADQRIHDLLIERGALSTEQAEGALDLARREGGPGLVEILRSLRLVDEDVLLRVQADAFGWGVADDIDTVEPAEETLDLLAREQAADYGVLPLGIEGEVLEIAVHDAVDLFELDNLRFVTGHELQPVLAARARIDAAIARCYGPAAPAVAEPSDELDEALLSLLEGEGEGAESDPFADEPPVVVKVNEILEQAVAEGASHVHADLRDDRTRVLLRRNGRALRTITLPAAFQRMLVARLKILAGTDVAERRVPQTGGFRAELAGRSVQASVSTLPVAGAERAVVALRPDRAEPTSLEELDAAAELIDSIRAALEGDGGFTIIGTSAWRDASRVLRAIAGCADTERLVVLALAQGEPLVPGIIQAAPRWEVGVSVSALLRQVERQDADVVLVEDLRDRETVQLCLDLSRRGRSVVGLMPVAGPVEALGRCLDMGVEPPDLAHELRFVAVRHALPRLCPECRRPAGASGPFSVSCEAVGCDACDRGYQGEVSLWQSFRNEEPVRRAIIDGAGAGALREAAAEAGLRSIEAVARPVVERGEVSPRDVLRL